MIWYVLVLLLTLLGAIGATTMKAVALGINKKYLLLFKNKWFYVSVICYVISAFLNILMLNRFEFSVLVPMMVTTDIWVIIIARVFFKEHYNWKK